MLYQEIRPKKLADFIGNKSTVTSLLNLVSAKTKPHTFLFKGPSGCGKCISGDTLIQTADGLKYIKDIVNSIEGFSDLDITVFDESGIGHTVAGYFESGVQTKKIHLCNGIDLEGTLEHRIRVINKDTFKIEWKSLGDLLEQDVVVMETSVKYPIEKTVLLSETFNSIKNEYVTQGKLKNTNVRINVKDVSFPDRVTSDLSKFLGYIISEGYISNNSIVFTNSNLEILDDFENLVFRLFSCKVCKVKDKRKETLYSYSINSALVVYYLKKHFSFGFDSSSVFVPTILMSCGLNNISYFLSSLFEGDGWVDSHGVGYSTSSERLSIEIQQLLLLFNIKSTRRISYKKCCNGLDKTKLFKNYTLYVVDNLQFRDLINFVSVNKRNSLNKYLETFRYVNATIPNICCKVKKVMDSVVNIKKSGHVVIDNKTYVSVKKPDCFTIKKDKITHSCLIAVIDYLKELITFLENVKFDGFKLSLLKEVLEECYDLNKFYFCVVKSIEDSVNDVYDISKIGEDKSFIANGLINHNTTLARILSNEFGCSDIGICEYNTANTRGIDTVREITETVYTTSLYSENKAYIFDEAHQLTKPAQEALLKVIEDCPKNVYFFFCTTEPECLIKTIRNRCAEFTVNKLRKEEIKELIDYACKVGSITLQDELKEALCLVSDGSPRTTLILFEKIIGLEINKALDVLEEGFVSDVDVEELIRILKLPLVKRKEKIKDVLTVFDAVCDDVEKLRFKLMNVLYEQMLKSSRIDDIEDYANMLNKLNVPCYAKSQLAGLICKVCLS